MAAVQVPHHGSKDSHFEEFWHKVPNKKEVPVFVSADGKYGLPAKEIVEFFDKNYKEIHSTNFAGGFRDYFEIRQGKSPEIEHRNINYPFFGYDQQFPDPSNHRNNYTKKFDCGEKQVKIEENGSVTIETKSAFS